MDQSRAIIKQAWPYQQDQLKLPVHNLDVALPFYEQVMGFQLVTRSDTPFKSAIVARDQTQLGLAENGGDPTQDGCFFEVDDVTKAFSELTANGWPIGDADFQGQQHGDVHWRVFFVVAPDGLCYCYGERH